jgi:hypothetical protein
LTTPIPSQSLDGLETKLKKLLLITAIFAFCAAVGTANAQQLDAAFNVSGLSAPSSSISGGVLYPSESGGIYPGFSADFLIHHRFGIEGEVSWKASQFNYGGYEPVRPVFYAFNALWVPRISKNISAEIMAGVGGEDLRFYQNGYVCSFAFGCTTYVSSNHFMGDIGAGIRAYFWHNAFIRPEARLYLINNNNEFSSSYATRYGIALGYSFGGK